MALNMLIYVNLCHFMQIIWVCEILKSTMTKSPEYQPGWKHKITLSESVEMTPIFFDKNTFLYQNCTVSKLPVSK